MTIEDQIEVLADHPSVPIGLVPTPTLDYRVFHKQTRATINSSATLAAAPLPIPLPIPIPLPWPPFLLPGARVLIWKQDPSVAEIGIRKAFLPGHVFSGPRDARITVQGVAPVSPNVMGDMIADPGTEAFDAVHTYAIVRQTLTMYQRGLAAGGVPAPIPWQWNSPSNTDPIAVFPRQSVMMNAFYSRGGKSLNFGFFNQPGTPPGPPWNIFTCRSLDIVAHETGHAVLDGLKPNWLQGGNPPQTGALHESFGDLTAIFLTLSQMDQCEAIIAQTKANLHDKSFLSDLAEQFGLALGRPNGLRNADNDLRLSQVTTEVHDLSQVHTGALYDILADIFLFERRTAIKDDSATLYDVAKYLQSLLLRALIACPASAATFVDVANNMLIIAAADGKPVQYRNFIRNRFTLREMVVSPVPLSADQADGMMLDVAEHPSMVPAEVQDRRGCCGTMQHAEYNGGPEAMAAEQDELRRAMKEISLQNAVANASYLVGFSAGPAAANGHSSGKAVKADRKETVLHK